MIPIAAVIAAATAIGVGAEHRWSDGAERTARRLMSAVLWFALPVAAFFNLAALHFDAQIGAGLVFAYVAFALTLGLAYLLGTYVLRLSRPGVGALMCASRITSSSAMVCEICMATTAAASTPMASTMPSDAA